MTRIFERVSSEAGFADAAACELLLQHSQDEHGYTQKVAGIGLTERNYGQTLVRVKDAFENVTGLRFYEFKTGQEQPLKLLLLNSPEFGGHRYAAANMEVGRMDSLDEILRIAYHTLNENEFFAVCSRFLVRAKDKKSFEEIAHITGHQPISVQTQLCGKGRTKLITALKEQAPHLAEHPFLRARRSLAGRTSAPIPKVDLNIIPREDPKTDYLLCMAQTLLDPDFFYIAAHILLADPSTKRDTQEVAQALGISRVNVNKKVKTIRDLMKDAIAFEPASLQLEDHYLFGKMDYKHESRRSFPVNPDYMDLDIPIVKKFYELAVNSSKNTNAVAVFCATHLYEARHKMSLEQIEQEAGLSHHICRTYSGEIKRAIRDRLRKFEPQLVDHPFLRQKDFPQKRPFSVSQEGLNLRGAKGTAELVSLCSALLNYRAFYAFVRYELCMPSPTLEDLQKEMNIPLESVVSGVYGSRKILEQAIDKSGLSDQALNNPVAKRWLRSRYERENTESPTNISMISERSNPQDPASDSEPVSHV